jgi:hypothetical protein
MRKIIQISIVLVVVSVIFALVATSIYNNNTALDNGKHPTSVTPVNSVITPTPPANTPNLVAALGVSEVQNSSIMQRAYNRLYIEGTVNNTGTVAASNVGLHVLAYAADGTLEVNLTVPLIPVGELGTDDELTSYILSYDAVYPIGLCYYYKSLTLGNLTVGESATVSLNIYHRGTVTNWSVTPVYTNST